MNELLRALAFHGKTPSVLAFVHLKYCQASCFMSRRVVEDIGKLMMSSMTVFHKTEMYEDFQ